MKMPYFSTFFLLVVFMLLLSDVCAEDSTQWKLPEGAIARLGKGWINDVKYFRDGSRFAVASTIGIWIYLVSLDRGAPTTYSRTPAGVITQISP